jgi:hypothetical protein
LSIAILVAEQEFDRAVLLRLETRRRPEHGPEFQVFRRRQRFQHAPLREQLLLLLDAGEDLQRRIDLVGAGTRSPRAARGS